MAEEKKGVGRWFGQADKPDGDPGEATSANRENHEHRVITETQPMFDTHVEPQHPVSEPQQPATEPVEPVQQSVTEPVEQDAQVYQQPESTPVEQPAEPAQSNPENELVVVELVGGERDNLNTQYGTFAKGVSVELNRRMADELLQLRDGDEPLFTEV